MLTKKVLLTAVLLVLVTYSVSASDAGADAVVNTEDVNKTVKDKAEKELEEAAKTEEGHEAAKTDEGIKEAAKTDEGKAAEEVVEESEWVDKKFDKHGVPVCRKPKPCKGYECKTPCHNGKCHRNGTCVCDDCWEGETCNAYTQTQECSDKLERQYPQPSHDEDEHDEGDNKYSEEGQENVPKRRKKRSKRRKKRGTKSNKPYSKSKKFLLSKEGGSGQKGQEIRIGHRRKFKLSIQFPIKDNQDMLVELFTPDNETTIMLLCNVRVTHVGDHLHHIANKNLLDENQFKPVMDAREGVYPWDRAILNLGNITCKAGATLKEQIQIWIEFEAVMIRCCENGKTYWVSAGAEYNNENEIWVGQASFKTACETPDKLLDTDAANKPITKIINNDCPSGVKVGESCQIILRMQMAHYQVPVAIDAIGPMDPAEKDLLSICAVTVHHAERAYRCLPKNIFQYINYKSSTATTPCSCLNTRSRLDLNNVTNAERRFGPPNTPAPGWTYNETDSFDVAVYVMFCKNVAVNKEVWLGITASMGQKSIYAGQTKIKALAADTAKKSATPTKVELLANSSDHAPKGGSVQFVMHIETKLNDVADYTVEFLMPFKDGKARMHICKIEVCASGWNIPCIMPEEPVYSSRATPKDTNMDRVVYNLQRIKNYGTLTANSSANTITVCMYATILDHKDNIKDATMQVTGGLIIGGTQMWIGSKTITVIQQAAFDVKYAPTMKLSYAFSPDPAKPDEHYVNSLADIRFSIKTVGLWLYKGVTFEMMLPFDKATNSPVLSICHVEILYAGRNLPCFKRAVINDTIQRVSKAGVNRTDWDRAVGNLGDLFNIFKNDPNKTNDEIVIRMVTKVLDHPVTNGTIKKTQASAGIQYDPTALWVGSATLNVITLANVPLSPEQAAFLLAFLSPQKTGVTKIKQGESINIQLVIKFPPQSTSDYEAVVETDQDKASICRFAIGSVGHNMKCMKTDIDATYVTWGTGAKGNKQGTLKLGRVTNPGGEKHNGTKPEKNAVVIDTAIKVASDIAPATKLKITGTVWYYEGTTKKSKTVTLELTVDTAGAVTTPAGEQPTFKFYRTHTNDDTTTAPAPKDLVHGQHFRCFLDIVLKPETCMKLLVKFMGPLGKDGVLDILELRVWGIGKDMPCTTLNSGPKAVISSRTGHNSKDVGSLDLGQVCSFSKKGDSSALSRVRVEVLAITLVGGPIPPGQSFWFSCVVKSNDDLIYVTQLQYKFIALSAFVNVPNPNTTVNATAYIDKAAALLAKAPHETFTIKACIVVPANSTCRANLDVKMEIDSTATVKTATMHLKSIKILDCGANLKGMCTLKYDPKITSEQTPATSQMTKGTIDLFVVTNMGVTERKGEYKAADDIFCIEAEIQMADSKKMDDKATVLASFGVKLCDFIMIVDQKVTVKRTGSEKPIYKLVPTATKTSYAKTEEIVLKGTLSHDLTSGAEAHGETTKLPAMHVKIFVPDYYEFASYTADKLVAITKYNRTEHYFTIEIDRFFFTDIINFEAKFKIKTDATCHGQKVTCTCTIPQEAASYMWPRAGNTLSATEFFPSPMVSVAMTLTGMTGTSKTCTAVDLGLKDNTKIKDCQITDSGEKSGKSTLLDIRHGATGSYTPKMMRGAGNVRFIQIVFKEKMTFGGIVFYKPSDATCLVTKIQMKYSNDMMGWIKGNEIAVTAYTLAGVKTVFNDGESAMTHAVRVYLLTDDCGSKDLKLQMDLWGCKDPNHKAADDIDPCKAPLSAQIGTKPSDETLQEFVTTSTGETMFYCHANPNNNLDMECFSSKDTGTESATRGLSKMAAYIIGYCPGEGTDAPTLFGKDRYGRSYMTSTDGGMTWVTVPKARVDEKMKNTKCSTAQKLAWDKKGQSVSQHLWSADYFSIKKGTTQLHNTGVCCT